MISSRNSSRQYFVGACEEDPTPDKFLPRSETSSSELLLGSSNRMFHNLP